MNLEWNKVTWYSKLAAIVIFGLTFWLGLSFGLQYQYALDEPLLLSHINIVSSYAAGELQAQGQHCGGFIKNAPTCPAGYRCQLGKIADQGGVCVKN